jgi:hypothetical protein
MVEVMQNIDLAELAGVCGGMNIDNFRPSQNIEDRRGLTRKESMSVKSPPAPPLPPLVRTPGDLSSQAGLDSIGRRHR